VALTGKRNYEIGLTNGMPYLRFDANMAENGATNDTTIWLVSGTPLPVAQWSHVVGRFDSESGLATLLVNGVPVLTALKITEEIVSNRIVKEAIAQTRDAVTDGKTIAQPLAKSKLFPQLMIDLLKIGEETGDVPGALQNIAETYENELSLQLRVLTNLIEPAMIIVMAVGVGGLLFSILSAMFAITNSLNR